MEDWVVISTFLYRNRATPETARLVANSLLLITHFLFALNLGNAFCSLWALLAIIRLFVKNVLPKDESSRFCLLGPLNGSNFWVLPREFLQGLKSRPHPVSNSQLCSFWIIRLSDGNVHGDFKWVRRLFFSFYERDFLISSFINSLPFANQRYSLFWDLVCSSGWYCTIRNRRWLPVGCLVFANQLDPCKRQCSQPRCDWIISMGCWFHDCWGRRCILDQSAWGWGRGVRRRPEFRRWRIFCEWMWLWIVWRNSDTMYKLSTVRLVLYWNVLLYIRSRLALLLAMCLIALWTTIVFNQNLWASIGFKWCWFIAMNPHDMRSIRKIWTAILVELDGWISRVDAFLDSAVSSTVQVTSENNTFVFRTYSK